MDEQHVGIAVPVADVSEGKLGSRYCLALEIHAVYPPCIRFVMVEIDLLWTARSFIRRGYRSLKGKSVGKRGRGQTDQDDCRN